MAVVAVVAAAVLETVIMAAVSGGAKHKYHITVILALYNIL
jgi:hypothetical protein